VKRSPVASGFLTLRHGRVQPTANVLRSIVLAPGEVTQKRRAHTMSKAAKIPRAIVGCRRSSQEADMGSLLAVRPIDLAILGTLGALWAGGAVFIYLLYRWILRYERAQGSGDSPGVATISFDDGHAPSRPRDKEPKRSLGSAPASEPALSAHA
jgi:hypothetical protein